MSLLHEAPQTIELAGDQPEAFDVLTDRIEVGEHCCLSGVAGTGKTVLARYLIAHLKEQDLKVVVTAPTHKAAGLLEGITLDSALGLRLVRDYETGGYVPIPQGDPEYGDVLVIDECSMVDPDRWEMVRELWDGTILCVGDPAQLPPVNNEGQRSPTFELPGYTLETILRQEKDNPIIEVGHHVRNHGWIRPENRVSGDRGVAFTEDRKQFINRAVREFSTEAWDEDPTHARILSYTNREVDRINRHVRNRIVGAEEEFVEGEWVIARDTYFGDDEALWYNSQEARVLSADRRSSERWPWDEWELHLEKEDGEEITVPALAAESEKAYERERERRLRQAREAGEDDRNERWDQFYELDEYYASPRYPYCTTVHKAQGSSLRNVFLNYTDFQYCRNQREHQALLYVGITRAEDRIFVLV